MDFSKPFKKKQGIPPSAGHNKTWDVWQTRGNTGHLPMGGDVALWLVHGSGVLHEEAKPVVDLQTQEWTKVVNAYTGRLACGYNCSMYWSGWSTTGAYPRLGMPWEVKAVGLTRHRQGEGESVVIHHIVTHVVELCIQACVRAEDGVFYEKYFGNPEEERRKKNSHWP